MYKLGIRKILGLEKYIYISEPKKYIKLVFK